MTTSLGAPALLLLIIVAFAFFTRYLMIKLVVGAGLLVPGLIAIIYGFTMFNSFGLLFGPAWFLIASGLAVAAVGVMLLRQFMMKKRVFKGSQQPHSEYAGTTVADESADNAVDDTSDAVTKGAEQPGEQPANRDGRIICEECGAINRDRNSYCTQCGERLPNLALLKKRKRKR